MKVFIGGSRAVSKLNAAIRGRIDDLIKRGCTILIGDANGADKAVQQYLADRHYPHVVIFCMEKCRNNIGNWPTRNVEPPACSTGFAYYSAKDIVMSQEARKNERWFISPRRAIFTCWPTKRIYRRCLPGVERVILI